MKMLIKIFLILICVWSVTMSGYTQIRVIDHKGSFRLIDSSKWSLSGINIFNKNTGNVGIGTNNPLTKFHINGSIRFQGLGTNTVDNNILTTDINGNVTTRTLANLLSGNAITSLNGLTTSIQTFATGTTGTDFNIASSGSTHTFHFPTASAINRGLLSSANWTTFNNKQNAISLTTTGTSGPAMFNGMTGALNIPNYNNIDSTTASNGLNLTGKDVRLGGNLSQNTTISNNGQNLTFATGGSAYNITGLPAGTTTDSLITVNNGLIRKIANTYNHIVLDIYDAAGSQTLNTTFADLTFGTNNIVDAGYAVGGGGSQVTITNAGTYRITYRATVRVTNNTSSGGEFQLTRNGTAVGGTLGYTYHHNSNRLQGTVTVVKLITITANDIIRVQGRRYSAAGNLTLTADGSSLVIERIK